MTEYVLILWICFFLQKHGPRMKCSACKIIAHANCIGILMERNKLSCKPTFRDVGIRQYREQTTTHHHWVHRRSEKGKCKQCGKVSAIASPFIDVAAKLKNYIVSWQWSLTKLLQCSIVNVTLYCFTDLI